MLNTVIAFIFLLAFFPNVWYFDGFVSVTVYVSFETLLIHTSPFVSDNNIEASFSFDVNPAYT